MHNQLNTRSKGKGKARATSIDEGDSDNGEALMEENPRPTRGRTRPKLSRKLKGRASKATHRLDDEPAVLRHTKRMRVHASSPESTVRRVRLRVGRGKEYEDDEAKGVFDDILTPEDRDTTQTSIFNMDKQRFERSRMLAEVHIF